MEQPNDNYTNNTSSIATFSLKEIHAIYDAVFRDSTDQPGFYYLDFGKDIGSKSFRQKMVELKDGLSNICEVRLNKTLNYQWLGRFNHQHSSGFHRDSAAPHSFLILGYEPTRIDSKVYLADYTKFIENKNMTLESYFNGSQDINTANKSESLGEHITELYPFPKDHYRLVILNNSKSFEDNTFGVFHRGEVFQKMEGEDRVINSIMLNLCERGEEEPHEPQAILDFVTTDRVDR